ncbi:uncharacterized protein LOC122501757 [Leptopilina heterotoma]|uniref:uncharacterized protein LOC122501757 n=1 Tax=Leptopilina heterotoma TaxID=63436 RepID=UPI001CA8EC43|nr:uncharacterized protein LOC122501757 [Leptopilina heterotoma]
MHNSPTSVSYSFFVYTALKKCELQLKLKSIYCMCGGVSNYTCSRRQDLLRLCYYYYNFKSKRGTWLLDTTCIIEKLNSKALTGSLLTKHFKQFGESNEKI